MQIRTGVGARWLSVLSAVAVLAGVLVVVPGVVGRRGADAVPGSPDLNAAPLVCGSGSLDGAHWSSGMPVGNHSDKTNLDAELFVRVWWPAGAGISLTSHVTHVNVNGNANMVQGVREMDGTYIYGHQFSGDYVHPANYSYSESTATPFVVNSGASRYVVVYTETYNTVGVAQMDWWVEVSVSSTGDGPECAELEASEFFGGRNAAFKHCRCESDVAVSRPQVADPVDVYSGNLHFGLPGVGVSGRGAGLGWSLVYNSLGSGGDVGVGFGWSHSYGMRLVEELDGTVVVHQENGATVRFWPVGAVWVAPDRASVSLVEHVDGSFTFTRMHFEVFDFDAGGVLVGVSDLHGNSIELVYDGAELEYVEDGAGRRLEFVWSAGRIVGVSGPGVDVLSPRTVTLSYDGAGDLVSYTDASGGVWSFSYDGHLMETIRRPGNHGGAGGAVVENGYDSQGRVVFQDDEADARTVFEYDTPGVGETTVTDPVGRETVHTYENGLRTGLRVAAGTAAEATWSFGYDAATLALVRVEDPNGNVVTHVYDVAGNRVETVDEGGTVFTAGYGLLDLVEWSVDGEGVRTEYDWDTGTGNLEAVRLNAGGSDERETLYVYGDSVHSEDVTGVIDPAGKVWSFTYDPDTGDRVSATDPLGHTSSSVFNEAGWLVSVVSARGNAAGANPADHTTTFAHDVGGRTVAVTDPEGGVLERFYDPAGRLVWEDNPTDDRTSYSYDVTGRVVEVERADASAVEFDYWPDGQLKTRWDGAGAVTGYTYDAAGRLASSTDPLSRATSYGYDGAGRRVWVESPGGDCAASPVSRCVVFSYDDRDQLSAVTYSDDDGIITPDVSGIAYDGAGRRTAMTDGSGTSSWEYNAFGELVEYTAGNGDVLGYAYDLRGSQTEVTYPGNLTVTRSFDDAGRWVGLGDWLGGDAAFGYDDNSNVTSIAYPSGTSNVDSFSFDDADRLSGVSFAQGGVAFGSITYTRDAAGRVTGADRTGLAGVDETYEYSPLDQLDTINTTALAYDGAENLVTRSDGATQVFDAGNQACWASPGGNSGACGAAPMDATVFSYDGSGRRVSATPAGSGVASTYSYDSADRMVTARVPVGDGSQGQFHALGSTRILDTRTGCGSPPCAKKPGGVAFSVDVAGVGGVPVSGAAAVVLNVTVVEPAAGGFVRLWGSGSAPGTSNLNHSANQIISNAATVPVGSDGKIRVYPSASTHVLIDVAGWYSAAGEHDTGSVFEAVTPTRVLDTRSGSTTGSCYAANGSPTTCATLAANGTVTFQLTGANGVPASDVEAVVANVTVINPTAPGVLQVYPAGASTPTGSNLNHVPGDVLAQMVIAKVAPNGRVSIDSVAATDVIVDIQGYFSTAGRDDGSGFHPIAPTRLFDTRDGTGAGTCTSASCNNLSTGESITFSLNGAGAAPATGVDAVVISVTAVNTSTTGAGHLRVHEAGAAVPGANSLSYQNAEIIANAVTTQVNTTAEFTIRNDGGTTDVIIDLQGWYSPTTHHWTYTYDGDGYRASKTTPSDVETEFTWDHTTNIPQLVSETTGGTRTHIVYGPGGAPYAQITGNDILYYHRDQLGSTTALTNTTGTPVATYAYDPYGNVAASTGTVTPLLGYTGEYHDTETGFTYLRARYYDPTTGQFTTRDPLEHTTHQPYAYANNNPTTNTDPLGLAWWDPRDWGGPLGKWSGDRVDDIAHVSASGIRYMTPLGPIMSMTSQVTGKSVGVCVGGNVFGVADILGSVCYMQTPTSEYGYTVTGGMGGGAPWGIGSILGPTISNAQCRSDLEGSSAYTWGAAGELHAGLGVAASIGSNRDGESIWQFTSGVAPGIRIPAPLSFGAGVQQTRTVGW